MNDYPSYIPTIIQEHFNNFLYDKEFGYQVLLETNQQKLASLQKTGRNSPEIKTLFKDCNFLSGQISAMNRLINDRRMEEVYSDLEKKLSDKEFQLIIYIAWSCAEEPNSDNPRARKRHAEKLLSDVEKTALKLAEHLQALGELDFPDITRLCEIPELLENADNTELDNRNFYLWRKDRKEILKKIGQHPLLL